MEIKFEDTDRGFRRGEFADRYGLSCSIQDSSLATEDAIWLGINDPKPKICVPGKGWQPVEFPEETLFHTRMHLTRDQVAALLPYLQRFVETGSVRE